MANAHRSRAARPLRRASTEPPFATATEAKNGFARLLDRALRGETVVIAKHSAPKAVLISLERFEELSRAHQEQLNAFSVEFDEMLGRMQGDGQRAAMRAAFDASPGQLGRAAVGRAKPRRA